MEISANSSSFWRKNLFVYKIISTFAPFLRRSPLTLMNNTTKHMKHFRLVLATLLVALFSMAPSSVLAQMSDKQVQKFIQRELQAGTKQSQIKTKLVQRGVKMEQIRRIQQQATSKNTLGSKGNVGESDEEASEGRLRDGSESTLGLSESLKGDFGTDITASKDLDDDDKDASIPAAPVESFDNTFRGKKVFGRDIFNNKLLTFEPAMNIVTPQNYVLGPGDRVVVQIYGASQKTEELEVSPEGTIIVPGYGPIPVIGLTVAGAQARLRSTLGARYASSKLSMSVGQTRTVSVNVMGEVRTPGTYTLSAFATVFHALYMAGGVSSVGTLRNIKVFRQGRQITSVDVYEYILNGRLAGNVRLQDNDVVLVGPYECIVDINGNVKRPMAYEMRSNESLGTLLKYAGGFTGDAYRESVRVLRKSGRMKSVFNVEEFDMTGFKVADGDSVLVDSVYDRYENMVEVRGSVFRPGLYHLGDQVNSVRSLISRADGLSEDAFTGRAVIHRMKPDRSLEVIPVDLGGILEGTVADVPLQNEDMLFVPSRRDLIANRMLTIEGEVQYPGIYAYADNETLEDLILQAGGLTEAASTAKVDVSRRIRDPKALKADNKISEFFSFSLKDGFVVDGTPGFKLEPFDVVYVRRSPNFVEPRNIRVEGEVAFEGAYTLSTKNQRLSDAIKAAGGVTDDAFVKGARLVRRMDDDEKARMQSVIDMARQSQDEKDSVRLDRLQLQEEYNVGIQLDKALANPGGQYDIVLRDSDRLVVPEFNNTVRISGSVLYPTTLAFNESKTGHKWYINQAGGFSDRAKRRRAYIIYQNGMVAKASKGKIEPGCEIVVPTKSKRDNSNVMGYISLGSSMASLATMFVSLANLIKK